MLINNPASAREFAYSWLTTDGKHEVQASRRALLHIALAAESQERILASMISSGESTESQDLVRQTRRELIAMSLYGEIASL